MSGTIPDIPEGDVLSQSEVERLLSQVQAGETSATVLKSGGKKVRVKNEEIQPCDFRQPAFLTSGELRRIRLRHEEFIRSLAAHLSIYLRMEVSLQMSKLQTLSYDKYTEALPNPTHLTLFKVEPLKGVCLLDLAPRLGLTFVDRLLGGSGHTAGGSVDLSEIEIALLDQITLLILNEWCHLWQKVENPRPVLLGHETSGRFLSTSAHDSILLILSMEARLANCSEQMQLAFPFHTIEPLIRLPALGDDPDAADSSTQPRQPKWNSHLDEVPIRINTQWRNLEMTAGQLATLKCGDVLLLEQGCFDHVEVQIEQQPRFTGRLGTRGNRLAVEITEPVKA
jgi:flagellar motor switch protein FliM